MLSLVDSENKNVFTLTGKSGTDQGFPDHFTEQTNRVESRLVRVPNPLETVFVVSVFMPGVV